jgi:hypothetical protein
LKTKANGRCGKHQKTCLQPVKQLPILTEIEEKEYPPPAPIEVPFEIPAAQPQGDISDIARELEAALEQDGDINDIARELEAALEPLEAQVETKEYEPPEGDINEIARELEAAFEQPLTQDIVDVRQALPEWQLRNMSMEELEEHIQEMASKQDNSLSIHMREISNAIDRCLQMNRQ